MTHLKVQCQTCGFESHPEVVRDLSLLGPGCAWIVHHIERVGGIVQVLTCPACANLDQDQILDRYKERIRAGFIPGIH